MADIFGYGERDYSKLVYFLIILISICSLWFFYSNNIIDLLNKGGVANSSNLPAIVIALFRTGGAYLAIHTVLFWMVFDKEGGFMYAYFYEKREALPHRIWGLERLVPFSSWNLLIFGFTFIFMSLISWIDVFGNDIPSIIHIIASILFSTSLGMAALTATIVTYVIIPTAMKKRETYEYLFEKHQLVMHNWVVILIISDLIITKPSLSWEFAIFGIIIGIIYVVFAYIFAIWGGGFFVYNFIDPRIKYAPIIMSLLALIIALFYIFVWVGLIILEWNYIIGSLILVGWVYSIVLFKPKLLNKKSL